MADNQLNKKELEEALRLSNLLEKNLKAIDLENLNKSGNAARILLESLRKEAEEFTSDISSAAVAFKNVVGEIRKTDAGLNQAGKSFNKLASIADKVQYHQREISKLSLKEVDTLKKQSEQESIKLEHALDLLRTQQFTSESRLKGIQRELDLLNQKSTWDEQDLKRVFKLESLQKKIQKDLRINADTQKEISGTIEGNNASYNTLVSTLDRINKELEEEKKLLGLGGVAVEGISKALNKLGFGGLASQLGLDEAKEKMAETAEEIRKAGGNADSFSNKFKVLKSGMSSMGSSLKANLTDPLVVSGFLIAQMVDALIKGDKATGDLAKDFNLTYNEAANVRGELTTIANLSGELAVNTRGLQESMTAIGKTLGSNAMLNEKDLVFMTKMREMADFTNEELVEMQKLTFVTGGTLENNTKNLLFAAKTTGLNNKVLLNEKDIMRDVAKASNAVKLSVVGGAEGLGRAAAQAKALGMNLNQLDTIASGLLDFESSISAELEAQLITGRDINLEQARLYALNNDMEGLSRELAKNFGTAAQFGKMNRIAQEAAAKAVGMSREDLAKTLTDKEALAKISIKDVDKAKEALAAARARGMSEEEIARQGIDNLMKQQSIQEKMNNAVEKLKELFVGIAETLLPILDTLSGMFEIAALIMKPLGAIISWAGQFGPIMKTIVGLLVAAGAAALFLNGSLTLGIGVAVALAAIGKGMTYLKSATSVKDAMIDPKGGLMVSGEKGTFSLDKNDTVIAGTNLNKSKETKQPVLDNTAVISALTDIKNILNKTYDTTKEMARTNTTGTRSTGIAFSIDSFGTLANTNTYKTQ